MCKTVYHFLGSHYMNLCVLENGFNVIYQNQNHSSSPTNENSTQMLKGKSLITTKIKCLSSLLTTFHHTCAALDNKEIGQSSRSVREFTL